MAHNKDSRTKIIGARMDFKSFEKFKKYADELGIGTCRLGAIACYIILGVLRDVEKEILEYDNKMDFKKIVHKFPDWDKSPYRWQLKPLNNIFKNSIIPAEARNEIADLIMQEAQQNGNNHKEEPEFEEDEENE